MVVGGTFIYYGIAGESEKEAKPAAATVGIIDTLPANVSRLEGAPASNSPVAESNKTTSRSPREAVRPCKKSSSIELEMVVPKGTKPYENKSVPDKDLSSL